ncbi:glutamine--fructose-6-phosphate transaminase (isomerizing) [Sulfuriflexus sp.]|uniref:glutamine--fructose-6-phosphate transaminase (isomerizing) n=1 Tax=Sulfuriflexus sp. TaxID=2015443 RepID=UPI0028CEC479|nr:glutamine--fructose-6-phosphate transaminase (isomerizing) [Sulfuriflexus sp.]MDT8404110.1 glutamine--fructose-6-phosphate transaminase (isomerizing) [Sulfuriflexus sp.]
MCGIVGAIAERDVLPILIEGLKRLEYRGYDSAGVALIDDQGCLGRVRSIGKVRELEKALQSIPASGRIGIAHTRWATHGKPSDNNAHPHVCKKSVAIVHNGIIENHEELRAKQLQAGHRFTSDTDTEVIVHAIHDQLEQGADLLTAVRETISTLEGAFALGVITNSEPDHLIVARRGSPLVIGLGLGENFIASDVAALLPVTQRFIILEEGDFAEITRDSIRIFDSEGNAVERAERQSELSADAVERGKYRHYMQKEIFEQPQAIQQTLEGRIGDGRLLEDCFGAGAAAIFDRVKAIQIVACGTSYHAGLTASYGFEELAGLPCSVEVASEFRYRRHVVGEDTLFVTVSQSGETADTLAALREAKKMGYAHTLSICNVPESSLVRESDLVLMTRAGPEIGVASTKAFTTQLVAFLLLVIALGRRHGLTAETEHKIVEQLDHLPEWIEQVLLLNDEIEVLSHQFADKHHALFLGRGAEYPVAMEGALKLKEISYIHAEAYPAGELKHGPLALVDADMPVIAVAPNDALLDKLKANLEEVSARGGQLIVFSDAGNGLNSGERMQVLRVAPTEQAVSPIIYSVPLQLLAYHVAVIKGTDIDQPRNLAKSVTVE